MLLHSSQHVRTEESAWSSTTIVDDAHQGDAILRRDEVRDLNEEITRQALQEVDSEVDAEATQAGEENDLVSVEVLADVAPQVVGGVKVEADEDPQRHVDAGGRLAREGDGVSGTSEVVLRGEECCEEGGFFEDCALGGEDAEVCPVHDVESKVVAISRFPVHKMSDHVLGLYQRSAVTVSYIRRPFMRWLTWV